MLDALKFVKGAVARKDAVAVLTHFRIQHRYIMGYNGLIALGHPLELELDCQPKATPFLKAIEACEKREEQVKMALTATGRLSIKCGNFRANVECSPDAFPDMGAEGAELPVSGPLLPAIKALAPMIAEDASKPWARGILFREGSAFATNNVVIGQYWHGVNFGFDLNIPEECVRELLRIKQEPVAIRATATSVTFRYSNGAFIRSQLLSTAWPDVSRVLDRPCNPTPVDPALFRALDDLRPYVDGSRKVYMDSGRVFTHRVDDVGASVELPFIQYPGIYNIDQIACLDGLVAAVDWSLYPAPALFFGPALDAGHPLFRGAVVGMRPD